MGVAAFVGICSILSIFSRQEVEESPKEQIYIEGVDILDEVKGYLKKTFDLDGKDLKVRFLPDQEHVELVAKKNANFLENPEKVRKGARQLVENYIGNYSRIDGIIIEEEFAKNPEKILSAIASESIHYAQSKLPFSEDDAEEDRELVSLLEDLIKKQKPYNPEELKKYYTIAAEIEAQRSFDVYTTEGGDILFSTDL